MTEKERTYIAIDLKSFYASVECKERNRDPLTTNLVVADKSRTEKTICLAVSPALKCYGIPGRARLFEVVQKVKEANSARRWKAPNRTFIGSSDDSTELNINSALEIDYIVAPPRMALYLEYSTRIYSIYLRYIAPEDIFPYSIDEVFMDVTNYLHTYNMTARELAMTMIQDVLKTTGITATAGIGTNMYLCKIAMDIVAKHIKADKDGVRIAELDEMSYRRKLWSHRPLTDFWRVGKGYAKKLEEYGLYTMGDIASCSFGKENELYNGVTALNDGSRMLKEGIEKYNNEGIAVLYNYSKQVESMESKLKSLVKLGEEYQTFTMKEDSVKGNTKFILIVDGEKAKEEVKNTKTKDSKVTFWTKVKDLFK